MVHTGSLHPTMYNGAIPETECRRGGADKVVSEHFTIAYVKFVQLSSCVDAPQSLPPLCAQPSGHRSNVLELRHLSGCRHPLSMDSVAASQCSEY